MNNEATSTSASWIVPSLKENWGWLAPVVYIYVTVMGMIQSGIYFSVFGINVFEFAEINDFLLAAFRQPSVLLLVVIVMIYSWFTRVAYHGIAQSIVATAERIAPRYQRFRNLPPFLKSSRERALGILDACIYVLVLFVAPFYIPFHLNDGYGPAWRDKFMGDPARTFAVQLTNRPGAPSDEQWLVNMVLVGTTQSFVFFAKSLQQEGEDFEIHIFPVASLVQMTSQPLHYAAEPLDADSAQGTITD